jgi:hypothetical protein
MKPNGYSLKDKIDLNIWDHIDSINKVLELVKQDKWHWYNNSRCKYINVTICMRDGSCIIRDSRGDRIDAKDLEYQYTSEVPDKS